MKKKKNRTRRAATAILPELADAAALDLGVDRLFVAVPEDRAEESVRNFGTTTPELASLAAFLKGCNIRHVAMEATGVYWMPVYDYLEKADFHVTMVNARHVKNAPGRKSDVQDCQWLLQLFRCGLLCAGFVPAGPIRELRSLMRHRENLVVRQTQVINELHKCMVRMNLQLNQVLADVTGFTGLQIIDAILGGERNPLVLARLRHRNCKSSEEQIAAALTGVYCQHELYILQQHRDQHKLCQTQLHGVDAQIEQWFARQPKVTLAEPPGVRKPSGGNKLDFDARTALFRLLGVDLTTIPSVCELSAVTLISEIGTDLSRFANAKHLANWLKACPSDGYSNGKKIKQRKTQGVNRVLVVLRLGSVSLMRGTTGLADWYRRTRFRAGPAAAAKTTAHKLLRVIYGMMRSGNPYDDSKHSLSVDARLAKLRRHIETKAKEFGLSTPTITLSPAHSE